jgi:hypothetical protein
MKMLSGFERHKRIKGCSHIVNTNEDNVHHFLRCQDIVHYEFIPQGQTLNQAYYEEVL